MSNSSIQVSGLRVRRGGTEILHQIDLDVPRSRVTGLIGPSGCGKTTLMRCIVGTQLIEAGRVEVLGQPAGSRPLRRLVGYASQAASVYPDLTIAENLQYFATVLGAPRGDVDRVLEVVALAEFRDRLTVGLSGGQRSRVSLGVALLGSPEVLVLDEPTVGLDPVLREQLWGLFAQLAHDGMTLLVSSHVMDEAERCDELVLMREGRVLAQESPHSLKQRTATTNLDAAFLQLVRAQDAA
jgi:ABC-2 type transport system ATP-binding protein